jgi:hypothetical protein
MPRGNQHWVEELDFAIEEWTLNGVRLVEVLGRVHLLEMVHQVLCCGKTGASGCASYATPRCSGRARVAAEAALTD